MRQKTSGVSEWSSRVLDICTASWHRAFLAGQAFCNLQLILLVNVTVPAEVPGDPSSPVDACPSGVYSQASGG